MQRIAIFRSLVNEDRHDRELIVWLKQKLFGNQELSLAVNKRSGILYDRATSGRTEIAGSAGAVLNTEGVVTTVPLQTLELESEGFTTACWNYHAVWGRTALASREIKPGTVKALWSFHVIQADINVALCVIAVLSRDIRPRAGQKCYCQLSHADPEILEARTVTAEIEWVEIVDFNMLAAIVPLACPEDGTRLGVT